MLICDISTSMRPVVQFLLQLIDELQDQVAWARSFAFVDDREEITAKAVGRHRRPLFAD